MILVRSIFVLFSCNLLCVLSGGVLELTLKEYVNKRGHDATSDHCDSFLYIFRTSKCDFYFTISLDGKDERGLGPSWPTLTTKVYKDTNSVNFGSKLNEKESNAIVRNFKSWKGRLNLRLKVTDHDNFTAHDEVDDIKISLDVKADGRRRFHQTHGNIGDSHFTYSVRVKCDPNYFGPACDRRCEPMNDNTHGHYRCTKEGEKECLPHWTHPDADCRDKDPCSLSPCQNGGLCNKTSNTMASYYCQCVDGYKGPHCEARVHACKLHDHCLNGGTCVEINWNQTVCQCSRRWTGRFCEQNINECSERHSPCINGTTCVNANDGYLCNCVGRKCSKQITKCQNDSCTNGAVCQRTNNGYSCACTIKQNNTHCHISAARRESEHSHKFRVIVPIVIFCLLILAVSMAVYFARKNHLVTVVWLRIRLRRKSDSDDTSVIMNHSDSEPKLEFKTSVYDCIEKRSSFEEATDDKCSVAFVKQRGDDCTRSTPQGHDYTYSSLANARNSTTAVSYSVEDKEDGYLQLPVNQGDQKSAEEEHQLRNTNDPQISTQSGNRIV